MWTTRLKREGGRARLERIRTYQFTELAKITLKSPQRPLADAAVGFLQDNEVRRLGAEACCVFGFKTPSEIQ